MYSSYPFIIFYRSKPASRHKPEDDSEDSAGSGSDPDVDSDSYYHDAVDQFHNQRDKVNISPCA